MVREERIRRRLEEERLAGAYVGDAGAGRSEKSEGKTRREGTHDLKNGSGAAGTASGKPVMSAWDAPIEGVTFFSTGLKPEDLDLDPTPPPGWGGNAPAATGVSDKAAPGMPPSTWTFAADAKKSPSLTSSVPGVEKIPASRLEELD
ncbi:hypothetical protein HK101_001758 [Irineochytrium annulatum]|nr:hypothetical protein HK101_001758 [Irineochytrium annulatum]